VEGSGRGLVESTAQHLPGGNEETHEEPQSQ
jgi:hypothetical protein